MTHLKICQSVTRLFGLGDHNLKNTWRPMVLMQTDVYKRKAKDMAREIVKSYFALPTWVKSVFQLEKGLISCVAEDKANSWQILGPFIRGKIRRVRRELYHLYEHVLSNKTRLS